MSYAAANAVPEWQARSLWRRSRKLLAVMAEVVQDPYRSSVQVIP
jgi:hypothetical protein